MGNTQIVTKNHFSDIREKLKELAEINSKTVFDYESAKGEKEARSHIYTMRQSKSQVSKRHKELKENILKEGREIDAAKNELIESIDSMIEVHDGPLRIKAERIELEKQMVLELEKFNADYDQAIIDNDLFNREREVARKEAEFKRIEEERKAKEEAERLEKERLEYEARLKAEAAENARIEAEERARKENEEAVRKQIEAEHAVKRAEEERIASEQRAKIEAEQAEARRLADIKLAEERAEQAERKRLEDIEAAKRQADIEKQQALEKQRKEQEAKERAEQERIAAEKAIEEKRAANKAHQKKINNEILSGLVKLGCPEETGKSIIAAIVKGEIKNISINY